MRPEDVDNVDNVDVRIPPANCKLFSSPWEAGLKVEDIDIYEINEAFASQATMCLGVLV